MNKRFKKIIGTNCKKKSVNYERYKKSAIKFTWKIRKRALLSVFMEKKIIITEIKFFIE